MRIPDTMHGEWYRLILEEPVSAGEPMEAKLDLARFIVARSYGVDAARDAEAHFTRVVREGSAPAEVPEAKLPDGDPSHLPALLAAVFGLSTSEARRMIAQGGVKLNGDPVAELDLARATVAGALVQAGKRRFVRFTADG
jgi:tyrosyl-tRNA synthetase